MSCVARTTVMYLILLGVLASVGSYYGKPNKTIHIANLQCTGNEERINECTQSLYSLEEGKNKLKTVEVAGVKCFGSNDCKDVGVSCSSSTCFSTYESITSDQTKPSVLVTSAAGKRTDEGSMTIGLIIIVILFVITVVVVVW